MYRAGIASLDKLAAFFERRRNYDYISGIRSAWSRTPSLSETNGGPEIENNAERYGFILRVLTLAFMGAK